MSSAFDLQQLQFKKRPSSVIVVQKPSAENSVLYLRSILNRAMAQKVMQLYTVIDRCKRFI